LQITKQIQVLCSVPQRNNTTLCSHRFQCYSLNLIFPQPNKFKFGPSSSVGIASGCGLDDHDVESWWERDFPPLQTGSCTNPASCKIGTGSFLGVKCGLCLLLTTHHLLVQRSRKRTAITLPVIWATPGL